MATCDLSDPQILEVYEKVKGSAPENWYGVCSGGLVRI